MKEINGELSIPKSIPHSDIAMYVVGNEMSKYGIMHGEFVLCCYPSKEQENVRNCVNRIVACEVNFSRLLRKVIRDDEDNIVLISGIESVPKIKVSKSASEVKVLGIAVAACNDLPE